MEPFTSTNKAIWEAVMKALRALGVAFLLAVVPLVSFAQQANNKELNPWIDCGIGAMIFDETGWAAAISNVIWDLGTTAVISNVSSQNTCNSKKAKTALYIGTTYANLSEETVKGDGKHLHAMLDIAGCQAAAHDATIEALRSDFARYVRDASYTAKSKAVKAEEFYDMVQKSLQSECRV
jgi:hypothetical protein